MPKLDSPLQLSPVFKPKIWGKRNLEPLYPDFWTTWRGRTVGIRYPHREGLEGQPIGEVWLTDDEAEFSTGPLAGLKLADACKQYGEELCGKGATGRFPVLAKFLFTSDWLSVQVHPDDQYAARRESGSLGKCEMWYIVAAEPDAAFLLGLKRGVTKPDFASALEAGKPVGLLNRFSPVPGEAIFVPPGTIHALGPGLTLFEAEENSDVTYRLNDFGRLGTDGKPRALHLEKGLEITRPEFAPLRDLPHLEFRENYGTRRFVLACSYFAVEEVTLRSIATCAGAREQVEALTVIAGEGRVETSAGWYAYRPGHVWLIPPGVKSYRLVPEEESRLLKFYVPDLDLDFRQPLAAGGIPEEQVSRIVFA